MRTTHIAPLLLVATILAGAVAPAAAGCKRRRATNVLPHERSLNAHSMPRTTHATELPVNYTWGDINGVNLLVSSWNQHSPQYCGSCFLHATLSMIQDRLKIAKRGLGPDTMLGRQTFLNCAPFHDLSGGCDGGDVIDVLRYMAKYGLPDESCMPYSATDHTKFDSHATRCPAHGYCSNCMPLNDVDTCWAVRTPVRYYLEAYGQVDGPGEDPMMAEIAARGPITCSMATPEVFDYGYHAGVAMDVWHNFTADDVDHDVEIVGWGETAQGQKYWVVRNSWGTYWGQMGFFLLERGTNALMIEAGDCWWAVPTWADEADIRSGAKVGTMWGVMDADEAAQVLPEPGKKPHTEGPSDDEVDIEAAGERDPWGLRAPRVMQNGDAALRVD